MAVGHDEAGKEIFNLLVEAGGSPYAYSKKSKLLRIKYGDPLAWAVLFRNEEMVLHYCSQVSPNFLNRQDPWGTHTSQMKIYAKRNQSNGTKTFLF